MADHADAPPPIALRPPDVVMRLARLGSFHQTRLSFMRVLLRRIAGEHWRFERPRFEIDGRGVGHAVYSLSRGPQTYSLVAFAHDLAPEKRTDRVIAEEWDATYALFDGVPTNRDIERLAENVPRQEAGRYRQSELILARSNKSVRLFDAVVSALAEGRQPDVATLEATGYLMRTTAVYGNGKFGIADRDVYCDREELAGPFQAEMLTVWLIRAFTVDLAEHLARARSPARAVRLAPALRRRIGIGNATGLGMAPFLVKHPALIDRWIGARETALLRVRELAYAAPETTARFLRCLDGAETQVAGWQTDDPVQSPRIPVLAADLRRLRAHVDGPARPLSALRPWNALHLWAHDRLALEAQEMLVSLMLEPHGDIVDDLAAGMGADERASFRIDGTLTCAQLRDQIDGRYAWTRAIDFSTPAANRRFWYVSEEKLEPRLGDRFDEPGADLEQPLAVARDVVALRHALDEVPADEAIGAFLASHPEHRHVVRRVLLSARHPYGEIHDNLIDARMRAIDLLRCKLSFFGCTRFDPRSDKWLRITLYHGAPFPDEIGQGDWDGWIWGPPAGEPAMGAPSTDLQGADRRSTGGPGAAAP